MDVQDATPRPARAPRRAPAKPSPRPAGGRRKRTLVLSDEAWRRLTVHAAYQDLDRSEVVEALLVAHCKRFVVHDHDKAAGRDRAGCEVDAA